MSSCYTVCKKSKTNHSIPYFENGKPSCSVYNPTREAEQFASMATDGFCLIVGYGAGLHIQEIRKRFPQNKIVVVEKNKSSINFLQKEGILSKNKTIICTEDELFDCLLQEYFPPLDGKFLLLPLRSWIDANTESFSNITKKITEALDTISRDISVQSHFGKLWHRNIIQNLSLCESHHDKILDFYKTRFPTQKTAFIAGAGPSLEDDYVVLKENRNQYFIIATDTAYHALNTQGIECDVIVSIDAQHISHSHVLCSPSIKNSIFALDFCANPILTKHVLKEHSVCFFMSEHPLCQYINAVHSKTIGKSFFPHISTSGGTVTLAALHFAKLAGFSSIYTSGCDFAYSKGKSYAKGIYMDSIFNAFSSKLHTAENSFTKIFFRTSLIQLGKDKKTTAVLQQYKRAYDEFFSTTKAIKQYQNMALEKHYMQQAMPSKKILEIYKNDLIQLLKTNEKSLVIFTLLPFISWYSHKKNNETEKLRKCIEITIQVLDLMV